MSFELIDPWNLREELTKSYLENQGQAEDAIYSADLSPSMVINSDQGPYCDRALAYKVIGTVRVPKADLGMLKIWEAGEAIHDKLQARMQKIYGNRAIYEVVGVIPELQMRMKGDGQLDHVHGLEIKTLSAAQYKKVIQSGEPLPKHKDQVIFYFVAFGWETCTFLFYCMDGMHDWEIMVQAGLNANLGDFEKTEVVMRADPERYEVYRRRIVDNVLEPVEQGKMPAPYRGRWCRTCPYSETCLRETGQGGLQ